LPLRVSAPRSLCLSSTISPNAGRGSTPDGGIGLTGGLGEIADMSPIWKVFWLSYKSLSIAVTLHLDCITMKWLCGRADGYFFQRPGRTFDFRDRNPSIRQGFFHRPFQILDLHRLGKKVINLLPDGLNGGVQCGISGQHDHLGLRRALVNLP
jgi:hypothetical protein